MAKKKSRPPGGAEKPLSESVYSLVLRERNQGHESRKPLIRKIESELRCAVLTFFTSFRAPVVISDQDADVIEDMLRTADLSRGLAFIISSPGGSGLAAERIINLCRSYSGTQSYRAIVPGKAKSAATLICFGASEIVMGPSSELGPVDPQIVLEDPKTGMGTQFALHNIVSSYETLFKEAVAADGNLQPYLQQLDRYDSREIAEYKSEIELSRDMAVKALKSGMMTSVGEDRIEKKIRIFLTPEHVKSHGRPILREEARRCGLRIRFARPSSRSSKLIHELYVRTYQYVNTSAMKCVETSSTGFYMETGD